MGRQFPIPREHLPRLHVSKYEHDTGKEIMAQLLAHTLREFEAFAYDRSGVVDSKRWKTQFSHDDLTMYRERVSGSTSADIKAALRHCDLHLPTFSCTEAALAPDTMMVTGVGPGRVEDAMSAVVTDSQQELAMVVTYMHQDVADCAIVHTMESPSEASPHHYLGYKYFVKRSPTNAVLVKHRDSLYLEYCGMTRSRTGENLGFHIMQSVDLPQFPDLTGHNSVRALQSSRYLYRQKSDRVVEVFMVGGMELGGALSMVKPFAAALSAGAHFGVTKLLDLAEVRRLTEIANSRQRSAQPLLQDKHRRGSIGACMVCKRQYKSNSKARACHLCDQSVCQRCRSTKRVWVSDDVGIMGDFRKVQVCTVCVMRANAGRYESPLERVLSERSRYTAASSSLSMSSSERSCGASSTRARVDGPTSTNMPPVGEQMQVSVEPCETTRGRSTSTGRETAREYVARVKSNRVWTTTPESSRPAQNDSSRKSNCEVSMDLPRTSLAHHQTDEYATPGSVTLCTPEALPLECHSFPGRARRTPLTARSLRSAGLTPDMGSHFVSHSAPSASPEQSAIMAQLMKLSSMAEATSATTQLNGRQIEQQLQQERLKMNAQADWCQGVW